MKKFSLALLALASALAITPAAKADSFFWSFTTTGATIFGLGTDLTGTFEATPFGNGYAITSGTIMIGGTQSIVSGVGGALVQNPSSPSSTTVSYGPWPFTTTYDNLLFPGGNPQLDANGLFFLVNGIYINIWANGPSTPGNPNSYEIYEANPITGQLADQVGNFNAQPTVPEPSSLFLLGTGLLGLALVVFRKAKPSPSMTLSM